MAVRPRRTVAALIAIVLLGFLPSAAARPAGARWLVVPSPNRVVRNGLFLGVACPAPDSCVAVGAGTDRAGDQVPMSARWDGVGWSIVAVPMQPGAHASGLEGISCSGVGACMAVGESSLGTLGESWNGSTWSLRPTPNPGGTGTSALHAVACPTSSMCMAAGEHKLGNGRTVPLSELWDGTNWTISTSPRGGQALKAVSCPSAVMCMAVGGEGNLGYPHRSGAFAEEWNGTSWKPTHAVTRGGLAGVACPSATDCFAVGVIRIDKRHHPLAERWDGTRWSVVAMPFPHGLFASELDAISCVSTTGCTAVGHTDANSGTLVESWDGSAWLIVPSPNPPRTFGSRFLGVACSSATSCQGVGYAIPASTAGTITLAEAWDGSAWSVTHSPDLLGAEGDALWGVSCLSASFCMAVGTVVFVGDDSARPAGWNPGQPIRDRPDRADAEDQMFAERWDGRRWRLVTMPEPAIGLRGAASISAVACASESFCTAVGTTADAHFDLLPFAETWDGTSWTASAMPRPPGLTSDMNAVSCASATFCVAVGDVYRQGTASLAEVWDGSTWAISPTPNPAGSNASYLDGVSCPGPTDCIAVGRAEVQQGSGTHDLALVERFDGSSWTILATPRPDGAADAALYGISCGATSSCMAVGTYSTDGRDSEVLAEHFDGTTWSIVATPSPPLPEAALFSVSCSTATDCMATGNSYDDGQDQQAPSSAPIAERWDGTAWTLTRTPHLKGSLGPGVVSCVGAEDCTAVGVLIKGNLGVTLVERYSA